MNSYPLRFENPQYKDRYVDYATAAKWLNAAFYDGFACAHYETADEWEQMTVEDRIGLCFMAVERCAVLRRETPPSQLAVGILR